MLEQSSIVSEWVKIRGSIELTSYGTSMYPLIREGDISLFKLVDSASIRVGKIYLFVTKEGLLVGHRLQALIKTEHGDTYIFKGDTNILPDEAVSINSILGEWVGISRRKRQITDRHWSSKLLTWLTIHMPKWPALMRFYISLRGL